MKILAKRQFAFWIDVMIFGLIYHFTFYRIFDQIPDILILTIFIPLFLRDIVFRNASIGKMIMGISIYDKNWKKPSLIKLIARSASTLTIGYMKHYKEMFTYGNKMAIIDWERDELGTFVIDKKVYKEILEQAKNMSGDFATNMTELYNRYLRSLYLKQ